MENKEFQQKEQAGCSIQTKMPCRLFLGFLLCVFLIVLSVYFYIGAQNKIKEGRYIGQDIASTKTITVSDSAEVFAKPDLGLINFSVFNEARTVDLALNENAKKMNAVIEAVKESGVEDKDLKITVFNIYPRYNYLPETGRRVFAGYEVRQTLNLKIRNLEKISQIIEGATNAGANEVGNLTFTIDNQDELKKQARGEAIEKAKKKAQELARQLGVQLVRISGFYEGGQNFYPESYATDRAIGLGGSESIPQIETGENKIEVSVSITYEIN